MTRQRFSAAAVRDELYPFQQRTVDHVIRRFYGPDSTRRFLVADETGLGKSIVARGVIARAIEKLQDDPSTNRIDVVYICSNVDLARQNLARLNVIGDAPAEASRLTLLAAAKGRIHADDGKWVKPVSVVSFTPGTSLSGGGLGTAEERLLLLEILTEDLEPLDHYGLRAAYRVFRGGVRKLERMEERHRSLKPSWTDLDAEVVAEVRRLARQPFGDGISLIEWLNGLITEHRKASNITDELTAEARWAIGEGRKILSQAGLNALSPDLVILDEFQRFDDLLQADTASGELAEQMFSHPRARVLLLSATPFKAFTLADEQETEDHEQGLFGTLQFLARGGSHHSIGDIKSNLAAFRARVVSGHGGGDELAKTLRSQLLPLMCRTERPADVQRSRVVETVHTAASVNADDLVEYAHLSDLARAVDSEFNVEYWKSSPYFANFMDGYQLHTRTKAEHASLLDTLSKMRTLPTELMTRQQEIDLGNAKLRVLAHQTVGAGWEKLLWVPPSLSYTEPDGPFADAAGMTKKLLFSSWNAAPTAVAALLTYEADRRLAGMAENAGRATRPTARLQYRVVDGRAASMSTLALFWPIPALAKLADPLASARSFGRAAGVDVVRARIRGVVTERLGIAQRESAATASESAYWAAAFAFEATGASTADAGSPANLAAALAPVAGEEDGGSAGALRHVEEVAQLDLSSESSWPPDLAETIADLAAFGPANSAWRALKRLVGPDDTVSDNGLWAAACMIADGIRSLFNRPQAMNLLDGLYGTTLPYWRAVLQYCADGNLQAVLDEYLHQLANDPPGPLTDERLATIADVARSTLSLRRVTFRAFDPATGESDIPLGAGFAMRYGARAGSSDAGHRPQEVRQAFNSPFWPFVLTSTSVGQEGIDFHPWCHSLVHWNIPPNPVDFEQREGRIDRFRGHAVRRNIAADLTQDILRGSPGRHPWDLAFELAETRSEQRDRLYASWLYDGPAKIERTLLQFPFSRDELVLERVRRNLFNYRLAFGQGRQEDFVELASTAGAASFGTYLKP
ncbi:helicase [Nakamurella sp. A5-74]|uniref:Helicase n=1 Tax=Nakamurella sp. A5-74 TaxID=3158264 RepID=A0AAU8DPA8_9ACTN